jgi:hypothetical protein
VEGQTVSVDFLISTVHAGRIGVSLCPEGTTDLKQCRTLPR